MSERVSVSVANHVAVVELSRPDKHNALDGAMFEGIVEAAEEVARDASVRAVVLHGAGPSFCSGLDLGSLMTGPVSLDDILQRPDGERANAAQRTCTAWIDVPAPVIAAIHGNCFGGGLQIALGADIRFAAPDARLSVMESKWGLVPDMGITSTLPRLVRIDVAKELTYTGRVVTGTEAAALGLVTRAVDDPLAAAKELAAEIAGRSPDAMRAAKKLYDTSWHGPVEEGLLLETELQVGLIGSPNQIEAVRSGLAKEPADFADPASVA
ncbi:MAG TPA: crotonase/enoyl-CoA hydratase family protein [Solirubrobacteraceae bacterium]|jgi:enoyl-CoA hydratase/carnithine racemase|nr:crotonase/enoyl-CoA hydratase family protein [Solirubrobacteraceae bacterium]